jgi:hypothetical protein
MYFLYGVTAEEFSLALERFGSAFVGGPLDLQFYFGFGNRGRERDPVDAPCSGRGHWVRSWGGEKLGLHGIAYGNRLLLA